MLQCAFAYMVCGHMHMQAHRLPVFVHTLPHMWKPEADIRCLSQLLSTLQIEGLWLEAKAHRFSWFTYPAYSQNLLLLSPTFWD